MNKRGFSMVELLVGLAVLCILMVPIMQSSANVYKAYSCLQIQTNLLAYSQLVCDQIIDEIHGNAGSLFAFGADYASSTATTRLLSEATETADPEYHMTVRISAPPNSSYITHTGVATAYYVDPAEGDILTLADSNNSCITFVQCFYDDNGDGSHTAGEQDVNFVLLCTRYAQ